MRGVHLNRPEPPHVKPLLKCERVLPPNSLMDVTLRCVYILQKD
jgi:hypothetical protein